MILGTCLTRKPLSLALSLEDWVLTATFSVSGWNGMPAGTWPGRGDPCSLGKKNKLRPTVGTTGWLPGRVAWALLQGHWGVRTALELGSGLSYLCLVTACQTLSPLLGLRGQEELRHRGPGTRGGFPGCVVGRGKTESHWDRLLVDLHTFACLNTQRGVPYSLVRW